LRNILIISPRASRNTAIRRTNNFLTHCGISLKRCFPLSFIFTACIGHAFMRVRTYIYVYARMRLYNAHFVFIARRWYHYRAARHVIPTCTSPDYLYGARRSLPRREKCTLDAAKPPVRVRHAYTRNTYATHDTQHARVSCIQWRVCAICIMDTFA